jgi:hypothetical protein
MRVIGRRVDLHLLPPEEAVHATPGQVFVSNGREYVVHCVSVYNNITFVQIVDDVQTPIFLPRVLFDVVDPSVPGDWICNVFAEGPVQMVLGPPHTAASLQAYVSMVDQDASQVERFWRRIEDGLAESTG